jgi:hypothetical protein
MLKKWIAIATAAGVLTHGHSVASTETPVLGLTIGAKFPPIKECTEQQVVSGNAMCWLDTPSIFRHRKSGNIKLPNADSRPAWAAYALFHASLDEHGILTSLKALNSHAESYGDIVASIRSRFGAPTYAFSTPDQVRAVRWESSPVRIEMICSPPLGCQVTFSTPPTSAQIEAAKTLAEKEKTRPAGP